MEHGWRSQNLKFSLSLIFICMFMLCGGRELRATPLDHKTHGHAYNRTLAKILVEYASAVYMDDLSALLSWTCSRCNGLTEGFEMVELIVDVQHCLQVNHGANDVQVVTFGQPRIGNSVFADYYNAFVPKTIRVTHEHDIVPHLPPYYSYFPQRTYHHFPREG